MKLNDPQLVRDEYASEAGLEARRSIYADSEGPDPRDEALRVVAELELRRRFAAVARRDIEGTVTFADHAHVRRYLESMAVLRGGAAVADPAFEGPLQATRRVSIFVAQR